MESVWSILACTGFLLILVPLVLSIVALARVSVFARTIEQLRQRLGHAEWQLAQRTSELARQREQEREASREAAAKAADAGPIPLTPAAEPATASAAAPIPRPIPARPPLESYELKPFPTPTEQAPSPVPIPHAAPQPVHAAPVAPAASHTPPRVAAFVTSHPPAAPRPEKNLEAFFGMRLFVIIGAICLAFAGIFLIKWAVDKNVFTLPIRELAGAIAGVVLIGVAQWRRRHEPFIAQGLAAAGIVALFAAAYAASAIKPEMVPVTAGFGLLAAIVALAVVLSLQRHGGGPLLATLGLIGGFMTPILLNTNHPNVPGLFGYLLLLHVGLVTVTRSRGWAILAALCMICSSAWLIGWVMFMPWNPDHGAIMGTFLLASVFSLVATGIKDPERWGRSSHERVLTWLAAGLGLFAGCMIVGMSGFSDMEWAFFGVLAAGAFVLARMRARYEPLAWAAALAILAMFIAWAGLHPIQPHRLIEAVANGPKATLAQVAGLTSGFIRARNLMTIFGLLSVAGAYGCLWKSASPVRWSLLAAILTIGYVITAYAILAAPPREEGWGYLPLAAAIGLAGMAVPIFMRRATIATGEGMLAVFGHTILALLLIAAPMAFSGSELTAAWALALPLAALAIWRLRLGALQHGLVVVFFLVTLRGLLFLTTLEHPLGGTLCWNPIVWAYGSILLCMIAALCMIERAGKTEAPAAPGTLGVRTLSGLLQAGAVGAALFMLSLSVRYYFHGGDQMTQIMADNGSTLFWECGTYPMAWLVLGLALFGFGEIFNFNGPRRQGMILATAAMAATLLFPGFFANPLFIHESVGDLKIVNGLVYVFGTPAIAAALFSRVLWKRDQAGAGLARVQAVLALILAFVLVTLEVRQFFQGEYLNGLSHTTNEMAAYSFAWAAMGLIYLAGGIVRQSSLLRWASLIVMLAAIAKVFLFDMADLEGLLRVLSFAGLGLSLMALAFVYQHFVFRKALGAPHPGVA